MGSTACGETFALHIVGGGEGGVRGVCFEKKGQRGKEGKEGKQREKKKDFKLLTIVCLDTVKR